MTVHHFSIFFCCILIQNTVFKTNKKIEEIKTRMKWDQQVLYAYAQRSGKLEWDEEKSAREDWNERFKKK